MKKILALVLMTCLLLALSVNAFFGGIDAASVAYHDAPDTHLF